jgi:hypothetical protein
MSDIAPLPRRADIVAKKIFGLGAKNIFPDSGASGEY